MRSTALLSTILTLALVATPPAAAAAAPGTKSMVSRSRAAGAERGPGQHQLVTPNQGRQLAGLFDKIKRKARSVGKRIKRAGKTLHRTVKQGVGRAAEGARKALDGATKAAGTAVDGATQAARKAFGGVAGFIKGPLGGAWLEMIGKVKGLLVCLGRAQKSQFRDLGKLFSELLRNPGRVLQRTVGQSLGLLGRRAKALVKIQRTHLQRRDPLGAVWSSMMLLSRDMPAVGCLMTFLRPIYQKVRPVANQLIAGSQRTLEAVWKKLSNDIFPKLADTLIDKVLVPLINKAMNSTSLGVKANTYIKQAVAEFYAEPGNGLKAAAEMKTFSAALRSRDRGRIESAYGKLSAALSRQLDSKKVGLRLAYRVASRLLLAVVEHAAVTITEDVVHLSIQLLSSAFAVVMRVVDGACGLIPEAGAAVCAVITGALRWAFDHIAQPVLRKLGVPVAKHVVSLIVKKVWGIVAKQIERPFAAADRAIAAEIRKLPAGQRRVVDFLQRMAGKLALSYAGPATKNLWELVKTYNARIRELATTSRDVILPTLR